MPRPDPNAPPLKPRMIRATDEEWEAMARATMQRGEFVAEATRRLWAEYVQAVNDDKEQQR